VAAEGWPASVVWRPFSALFHFDIFGHVSYAYVLIGVFVLFCWRGA